MCSFACRSWFFLERWYSSLAVYFSTISVSCPAGQGLRISMTDSRLGCTTNTKVWLYLRGLENNKHSQGILGEERI